MIVDKFTRPMRDLRISVIDACNFRCTYCMPLEQYPKSYSFINKKERLTFDEIIRLVKIFGSLGIRKVRLTGGEPLLRKNLPMLVKKISAIPEIEDIALTSNGFWLEKYASELKEAGLNRVTVSLDALNDEIFGRMNGRGGETSRVLDGIKKARNVGLQPLKINVLVQRGVNEHCLIDIARYFKGSGDAVRFIEYMDVGNRNGWHYEHVVTKTEILERINRIFPLRPIQNQNHGAVAERYRYKDGEGEIGVISSVTQPFCGSCSRVRLSSDGKLYTCLFANQSADLRTPMRTGATDRELEELVVSIWQQRTDRYSEMRASRTPSEISNQKVEMYQIGG